MKEPCQEGKLLQQNSAKRDTATKEIECDKMSDDVETKAVDIPSVELSNTPTSLPLVVATWAISNVALSVGLVTTNKYIMQK